MLTAMRAANGQWQANSTGEVWSIQKAARFNMNFVSLTYRLSSIYALGLIDVFFFSRSELRSFVPGMDSS